MDDPFERGARAGTSARLNCNESHAELKILEFQAISAAELVFESLLGKFVSPFKVIRKPGYMKVFVGHDSGPYLEMSVRPKNTRFGEMLIGDGYLAVWPDFSSAQSVNYKTEGGLSEQKVTEIAGMFFGFYQR